MTGQAACEIGLDSRRRLSPERHGADNPANDLRGLAGWRRPNGHIVAFANEKGGVGKSTLAFHCALALAHRGKRVLAIDCDRRQQSLHRFLEARDATVRTLGVTLPKPRHTVLETQSGPLLQQEIDRLGQDCDFVLVDLAGHDTPTGRRAIAVADTIVTPVGASPADLDSLGSISPVSHRLRRTGSFAAMVNELGEERRRRDLAPFDWVVVKNRVRHCERRLIASADRDLATLARHLGFRLIFGLTERLAYRDLLPFGLSHVDLGLIPGLGRPRTRHANELLELVEGLQLPDPVNPPAPASRPPIRRAPVSPRTVETYRDALFAATAVPADLR